MTWFSRTTLWRLSLTGSALLLAACTAGNVPPEAPTAKAENMRGGPAAPAPMPELDDAPAPPPSPIAPKSAVRKEKEGAPNFLVVLGDGRIARVPLRLIASYISKTKKLRSEPEAAEATTKAEAAGESLVSLRIPGKGYLLLPVAMIAKYVDPNAKPGHRHGPNGEHLDFKSKGASMSASGNMRGGEIDGSEEATFHTDYELGECEFTDEQGFVTQAERWHRHPHGTEYTETWEP